MNIFDTAKTVDSHTPSFRLWSLWDMLTFKADHFTASMNLLGQMDMMGTVAKSDTRNDTPVLMPNHSNAKEFKEKFDKLRYHLKELQLEFAVLQIDKLMELLQKPCKVEDFGRGCAELRSRIEDSLKLEIFFKLDQEENKFFTASPKEFFGETAYNKLQIVRYDMEESLKCYALERYTGCVGHLTKIVEQSLREFAAVILLNGGYKKDGFTPIEWANISQALRKEITSQNPKNAQERDLHDKRLVALDRFENVRNVRNNAHHPDIEYNRNEARDFITHIQAFVKQIVEVI